MTAMRCANSSPPKAPKPSSPATPPANASSPTTSPSTSCAIASSAASTSSNTSDASQHDTTGAPATSAPSSTSHAQSYGCDECRFSLGHADRADVRATAAVVAHPAGDVRLAARIDALVQD